MKLRKAEMIIPSEKVGIDTKLCQHVQIEMACQMIGKQAKVSIFKEKKRCDELWSIHRIEAIGISIQIVERCWREE